MEARASDTNFTWYFDGLTSRYTQQESQRISGFQDVNQFVHFYILRRELRDSYANDLRRLIGFVSPVQLGMFERLKINCMLPHGDQSVIQPPHVDWYEDGCLSMIYYIADSDGDTVLYEQRHTNPKKTQVQHRKFTPVMTITPRKGRAVIFSANQYHSSSTPCYADRRLVLNMVAHQG